MDDEGDAVVHRALGCLRLSVDMGAKRSWLETGRSILAAIPSFLYPFLYPSVLHLHYHLFVCLFFYIVRPTHFYLFDFEDSRSGSRDSLC